MLRGSAPAASAPVATTRGATALGGIAGRCALCASRRGRRDDADGDNDGDDDGAPFESLPCLCSFCAGGNDTNDYCARRYRGPLCTLCEPGLLQTVTGSCIACKSSFRDNPFVVMLLLCGVVLALLLVYRQLRR
jgi:hypothetical protein